MAPLGPTISCSSSAADETSAQPSESSLLLLSVRMVLQRNQSLRRKRRLVRGDGPPAESIPPAKMKTANTAVHSLFHSKEFPPRPGVRSPGAVPLARNMPPSAVGNQRGWLECLAVTKTKDGKEKAPLVLERFFSDLPLQSGRLASRALGVRFVNSDHFSRSSSDCSRPSYPFDGRSVCLRHLHRLRSDVLV